MSTSYPLADPFKGKKGISAAMKASLLWDWGFMGVPVRVFAKASSLPGIFQVLMPSLLSAQSWEDSAIAIVPRVGMGMAYLLQLDRG